MKNKSLKEKVSKIKSYHFKLYFKGIFSGSSLIFWFQSDFIQKRLQKKIPPLIEIAFEKRTIQKKGQFILKIPPGYIQKKRQFILKIPPGYIQKRDNLY